MTDQINQHIDDAAEATEAQGGTPNRRRMFIAGAGLAGAAAIVGSKSASAADNDNVVVGGEYTASSRTEFDITTGGAAIAGPDNALKGIVSNATNGSHAILGTTAGDGHAVAGASSKRDNARATTWGKHEGLGAGIGGENNAADVDIAGPARGVEGLILEPTNGSHAVYGETAGGGHSVAGDTPADASGPAGVGPNTTAATWGRHGGVGAGIGGVSAAGYGGEFIGGKASVRLIPQSDATEGAPTDGGHLRGELYVDGAGTLWYNAADGNNWFPLNQSGNVLWTDPARAYDSRANKPTPANSNKTKFRAGEVRSIDLTEFTEFPASATAALINLTVVNAEGRGFATLFNGATADADRPDTSNINWDTNTSVIANSATVRADANGVVKVYTSMPTNIVIDVQGYIA